MKRRISSIALLSLLVIALAIVPVLALTVSAADSTTVSKTGEQLTELAGVSTASNGGSVNGIAMELDHYITVQFDQGEANNPPAYYSGAIRLYQNGATLTVSANGATMTTIVITTAENFTGGSVLTVTGGTVSSSGGILTITVEAGATEVVIETGAEKANRLYVANIAVTYELQEGACAHDNTHTEITKEPTCTEEGTEATICNDCGNVLSTETIDALEHNYVDGICSECGNKYEKWILTDITDIKENDVVVITVIKNGKVYAMTNDKGGSNPPIPVEVAVENGDLSGEIAANLKWNIFNDNGNLTIYPNGKTDTWLYCTSTNNGVRVGTNANKVFTIDDASGYLKNTATNRYLGVYNTQDWRCYTSPTATNIANQTLGFYVLHTAKISAAQLQIDDTLAIKYLVTVGEGGCNASDLAIRFTYGENGDVVTTVGNGEIQADGRYAFLLTKLAPQSMTDNVKAELLCGGVVIDTVEEYSIKQYAANMIKEHSDDAELVRLLSDMLHYGAAAQNYLGYKTDNLASDGVEGILDAKTDTVPDAEKNKTVNDNSNVNLTAAGVRFDYNNKVYIRFTATDISVVTAFVNGVEAEIVEAGGVYTVYSEGITANNFATAQTFEVKVDGDVVLTVNYSVNAYCGVKGNGTNEAAALAKAMYFYGFAAEAYEA